METNQKTLHKEILKIPRTKINSPEALKNLSVISKVCNANKGQPILFGEKVNEYKNHNFGYFALGVIEERTTSDYEMRCRYQREYSGQPKVFEDFKVDRHQLTLPVKKHIKAGRNFTEFSLKDSQVFMVWNSTSLYFLGENHYSPNENKFDILCHTSLSNKKDQSALEIIIGVTSIEDAIAKDPFGELGNYLAQMNVLGLKPSRELQRQTFEEYFRRIISFDSDDTYLVKEYLKYLRNMGFENVEFETEPMQGVIVNPKKFIASYQKIIDS